MIKLRENKNRINKIIMLVVAIVVCALAFTFGAVSVSAESRKVIHIVYDDTAETYYDGESDFSDKWSRVKNALQTFISLTNVGDKVVIYPISGNGEKIELVNDLNINKTNSFLDEKLVGYATERSFKVVTKAHEDLKKESVGYEKWLLIVCDGMFEEYKEASEYASVQKELVSYAKDNIKVISHAMSNKGAIYNLKSEENFYCYNTSDTKDIIQQTIEISNFIYQRKTLPDEYFKFDKKENKLTIKGTGLPLSQMILCVNGAEASAGGTIGGVKASSEIKIDDIKHYPKIFKNSADKIKFAANQERNIYNYEFSDLLQFEEIDVNVFSGDSVYVIYKAEAEVKLSLYHDGDLIGENESISTGKYSYRIHILNPISGVQIKSPLLDGAVYEIKIENQSDVAKLTEKEGEISFLKGNTKVETSVDLGTLRFVKNESFYVFGDVDFSFVEILNYAVDKLDGCKPIRLIVKTESLPENIELSCSSAENIDFRIERSSRENEFLVYPMYKNGEPYLFAPRGNIDVVFCVSINENGGVLTYSKTGNILISDVSKVKRVIDWVWYYKWFLIIVLLAVVCYIFLVNFIFKKIQAKKNISDEADKEAEEFENIDLSEEEKESEDLEQER